MSFARHVRGQSSQRQKAGYGRSMTKAEPNPYDYLKLLDKIDAEPQPWDDPEWTCCGDAGCPFVSKCRDGERLDAAWNLFVAEQGDADA